MPSSICLQKHKPVVIAGDFNHTLTQQEVDGWLSNLAGRARGIDFAFHDGVETCKEAAEQRYLQQKPNTADAAAALNIKDSITYYPRGGEIDRICSIVPAPTSPGTGAADGPLLTLVCNKAAATCVIFHAGFNHGPRTAKFSLPAPPSSPGGFSACGMGEQGRTGQPRSFPACALTCLHAQPGARLDVQRTKLFHFVAGMQVPMARLHQHRRRRSRRSPALGASCRVLSGGSRAELSSNWTWR